MEKSSLRVPATIAVCLSFAAGCGGCVSTCDKDASVDAAADDAALQDAAVDDAAPQDAAVDGAALHDAVSHDVVADDAALHDVAVDDAALPDAVSHDVASRDTSAGDVEPSNTDLGVTRDASSVDVASVTLDLGDLEIDPSRLPVIHASDRLPVDTSPWTEVPYSGPLTGEGVKAAIDISAPQTILVLPAGTYSGTLVHRRSNVVVRGDCSDIAAVRFEHSGNPQDLVFATPRCAGGSNDGAVCWGADACPGGVCDESVRGTLCGAGWIQMCGADSDVAFAEIRANPTSWTDGFDRFTTTISVADGAGFQAGDWIWMQSDVLARVDEDAQVDAFTYMAKVASVSGQQLTLDRSLPITFSPSGATVFRLDRLQRNAGVECLSLVHNDAANPDGSYLNINLSVYWSVDSWIYKVDLGDTFNQLANVHNSSQFVIQETRFGHQLKSLQGDGETCDVNAGINSNPCWNKQAIVYSGAHDNSLVDSVIESSIGVQLANSSCRNWIAYNYFPEPSVHPANEPRRALFPHGHYGHDNVFEGNLFWGVGEMDQYWGSQGPRYTWFRNVAYGPGSRFSTEAWIANPNPILVGTYTNYLLNHGARFTLNNGAEIDVWHAFMHLERNVYTDALNVDHATSIATTAQHNYHAATTPLGQQWDDLSFPDSLNQSLTARPAFWCSNTVSSGGPVCDFAIKAQSVGAFWNNSCKLPAQQRFEGGSCQR